MKVMTTVRLREFMESAVMDGTARKGAPDNCKAGAKTGTAQTGAYQDGDELNHHWYAGYIKDASGPRYCITVLCESAVSDEGACAAVFKELADYIAESIF